MDISRFGGWLQIAANIGILAGLILVALQLQQNTDLMRLQLLNEQTSNYETTAVALAGENYMEVWQKSLEQPENLSLAEMSVMETSLFATGVRRWKSTYQLYQAGLIDSETWQRDVSTDVPYAFGNTYGRAWWKNLTRYPNQGIPAELENYINDIVDNIPRNMTIEYFSGIQQRVASDLAVSDSK